MAKGPVISTGRCRHCGLTDAHPRLRHGPRYTWDEAKVIPRGQRVVVQTYGGFDEATNKTRQRFYQGTVRQVFPVVRVREDSSGQSETVTASRLYREAPAMEPERSTDDSGGPMRSVFDSKAWADDVLAAFYRPDRSAITAVRLVVDRCPLPMAAEALAGSDLIPMTAADPDQIDRTFFTPAETAGAFLTDLSVEEIRGVDLLDLKDWSNPMGLERRPMNPQYRCTMTVGCTTAEGARMLTQSGWLTETQLARASMRGFFEVKGVRTVEDLREFQRYQSWQRAPVSLVITPQGPEESQGARTGPFPNTRDETLAWASSASSALTVECMVQELRDRLELPRKPARWQMLTLADLGRIFPRRRRNGIFPQSAADTPAGQQSARGNELRALARFIRLLNSSVLANDADQLAGFLREWRSGRVAMPGWLVDIPVSVLLKGYALVDLLDEDGPVIAYPDLTILPPPTETKLRE